MSELQELIAKFEVIQVDRERPSFVPAGWIVFNAPRPLCGTLVAAGGVGRWEDYKGPTGWHFASIDPDDPLAPTWVELNRRDKAVIVQYSD